MRPTPDLLQRNRARREERLPREYREALQGPKPVFLRKKKLYTTLENKKVSELQLLQLPAVA